jgi:uncharacterized protein YjbI with pentapeptide repeats
MIAQIERAGRRCAGRVPIVLGLLAGMSVVGSAADLSVREVTEALFRAAPSAPVDLARRDLSSLDLSGLDFKRARLGGANLFGANLSGANLTGADLAGARLDRAVLTGTDFSGASLRGASLLRPTVHSGLAFDRREAPWFAGADLAGIRITARLDGAVFRGANLARADISPHETRGDISSMPRNLLPYCDFTDANLEGANLQFALLTFAKLVRARLVGANLADSDLSKADLSGADVTGADLTGADLDGAILTGAVGLDTVRGLDRVVNLERAVR